MAHQGDFEASGVLLARAKMGESALWLTLFLKEHGIIRVSAPGANSSRSRFGGSTEPFLWGSFRVHSGRSGGRYLSGVEIADDMLGLRRRPDAVFMAVRWSRLIQKFLVQGYTDNELLANLYWNMLLLCDKNVPVDAAEWRFLYRWLTLWGLAPDIQHCALCGGTDRTLYWTGGREHGGLICGKCSGRAEHESPPFTSEEQRFLHQFAFGDTKFITSAFAENTKLTERTGLFRLACRCCGTMLYQK